MFVSLASKFAAIVSGVCILFLPMASRAGDEVPVISRIQGDGRHVMSQNEVVVVWGDGLIGEGFRLVGANPKFDEAAALAALEGGIDAQSAYAERPPAGSQNLKILNQDPAGRTVSAFSILPAIIWA